MSPQQLMPSRMCSTDVSGISQLDEESASSTTSSCSGGEQTASEGAGVSGNKLIEESIQADVSRRLLLKFCQQAAPQPFEAAFPHE